MKYTLGQAAKATGKSKSTISAAVKDGRISSKRTETGAYAIDPAELHRVFAPIGSEHVQSNETAPPKTAQSNDLDTLELFKRLGAAEAQVETMREMLDEMRGERDHLRQLQIADQRKGGFWGRLFGKAA